MKIKAIALFFMIALQAIQADAQQFITAFGDTVFAVHKPLVEAQPNQNNYAVMIADTKLIDDMEAVLGFSESAYSSAFADSNIQALYTETREALKWSGAYKIVVVFSAVMEDSSRFDPIDRAEIGSRSYSQSYQSVMLVNVGVVQGVEKWAVAHRGFITECDTTDVGQPRRTGRTDGGGTYRGRISCGNEIDISMLQDHKAIQIEVEELFSDADLVGALYGQIAATEDRNAYLEWDVDPEEMSYAGALYRRKLRDSARVNR